MKPISVYGMATFGGLLYRLTRHHRCLTACVPQPRRRSEPLSGDSRDDRPGNGQMLLPGIAAPRRWAVDPLRTTST